jgi:hypothetical protein
MELSLYMSNRLEVYLKIYAHAPPFTRIGKLPASSCRYVSVFTELSSASHPRETRSQYRKSAMGLRGPIAM